MSGAPSVTTSSAGTVATMMSGIFPFASRAVDVFARILEQVGLRLVLVLGERVAHLLGVGRNARGQAPRARHGRRRDPAVADRRVEGAGVLQDQAARVEHALEARALHVAQDRVAVDHDQDRGRGAVVDPRRVVLERDRVALLVGLRDREVGLDAGQRDRAPLLDVAPEDVEVLLHLVAGRREVGLRDLDVVELDELGLLVDERVGLDPDDAVGRLRLVVDGRLDLDGRPGLEDRVVELVDLRLVDGEGDAAVLDDARPLRVARGGLRLNVVGGSAPGPGPRRRRSQCGDAEGHQKHQPRTRERKSHRSPPNARRFLITRSAARANVVSPGRLRGRRRRG